VYNDKTTRVEQAIIAMLRDRLATSKTSNEMFRVFSKFNALFIRPAIRGAIQEYQTRLIDNVKMDIASLHDKFRQQYSNSEAHEMSKLRDLPSVSGTIIFIRQIENQLDSYVQKVEDVLGKGWNMYAEGQKLHTESSTFRKKLDTRPIFENWLTAVSKKKVSVNGFLFRITKTRSGNIQYDIAVNFDPQAITLFKEVRNLQWLNFQVPHSIVSVSKDAKRIYPFAVSLMDIIKTLGQTLESIRNQPEVGPLLYGYENEVYQLISKGVGLKWESFVHAYDLKTHDRTLASTQSRHVRFVSDLDTAVTTLETRTEEILEIYANIDSSLNSLKSCAFDAEVFTMHLESIQEYVDKLNLEAYSNISDFVDSLNRKIKEIFVTRCEVAIEEWLAAFASAEKSTTKLAYPLKIQTHELTLKNQVISLNPPIETTRVYWLKNFHNNIASVCKLSKIDAHRFNVNVRVKKRRTLLNNDTANTFMEIPSYITDLLLKVYSTIDSYLRDAEEYLEKWYQFQSLWDLEPNQVFESLGSDMQKWLQILNEIRKERATFDTTDVSRMFGLLNIDFKPVQARINSKYDAWQNDIIHRFSKQLGTQMKEVCSEMESARRELEKQSLDAMSTELVVATVTTVQSCKHNLPTWEKSVQLFRNGQTTLSRYRFQFPSNWLFIDQIDNELAALKEILVRKSKVIDDQIDGIRARVETEMKRLTERINVVEEKWSNEKPVSGAIDPKVALKTLSTFGSETDALSASSSLLTRAAEALDLDFTVGRGLEAVQEEVRDFNTVWGALDGVWESLNDLRETPWISVVPRKVRQQLEEFIQVTKNMPTRIRQYSAFEHIQNVLKTLTRANTLVTELKSEAIHERHWERLYKSLLPKQKVFISSMTLGNVWDLNLVANQTKVQDVIAIAQGEMALEIFLRQVKDTWTNYVLELVNYRNMCHLIKNWDELFQTCSEHLNSLQAMHHSPYFKVFEEEARAWEDKLNRIHVLFDTWIDAQRQWVYLEGVFNNNAEINNVLPVEASRFQNINSELFVILRKVYKSPLVLDVLNINGIQTSIERLSDMLGRVQKALGEYFEKERQRFARFYFIGDEDLLEIIGNSSDIHRTEKHLGKMFLGISGLVYDQENSMITGIRSKEGETVMLVNPISLIKVPKVVDWLIALEEEAKITLSEKTKHSLESLETLLSDEEITGKKLMLWIQKFPCQSCILSTQIKWTESVGNALEGSKGDLATIKGTLDTILGYLAEFVLQELTLLDRKKCESLVTELIHQRDVLAKLIHKGVSQSDDFLWKSQMTFKFQKDATPLQRLSVHQANAEFSYGYEYLGVPDKLVCTPLIDKLFLTMTQALDQKLGGSPFGPAGTGKGFDISVDGRLLTHCR
jgi:dynein heavy chain 1